MSNAAQTKKTLFGDEAVSQFRRDGFYFPIPVLTAKEVANYRCSLERTEQNHRGEIARILRSKPHLVLTWANELIRQPRILDAVENILGPNILCWGSTFFIKEARDPAYVSWHQDSTYWGLDSQDIVTAWIALSDVAVTNGAMQFVKGTHTAGQMPHRDTNDNTNMLSRGQVVEMEIDRSKIVDVPLRAGEMSFHHVRLVHGSTANTSDERRLGFAVRYIPTRVCQVVGRSSATLVRGEDSCGHFIPEPAPSVDMDPIALEFYEQEFKRQQEVLYKGASPEKAEKFRGK